MQRQSRFAHIALAALASVLFTSVATALNTGSQTINTSKSTPSYPNNGGTAGPFAWDIKYVRSFDGTKLLKHVEIDFTFDAGLAYTAEQKQAYKNAAETNIENSWNNKFWVRDNATSTYYPTSVDVTTTGPFDQTVLVKQTQGGGDPSYNMTHWYTSQDTASFQAHEFGHMLGLCDEYLGGAVDQFPNPTLSDNGLMGLGALNANPVMYPRYFQQYLDYMNQLNPTGNFTLISVPEPGALVLITLVMGAGLVRRRAA